MNIKKVLLVLVMMVTSVAFLTITGCEGPAGPAGADGVDGIDGTDGTDGNLTCLACHTQDNMDGINDLFALSGHYAGGAVGYAGSRSSCSPCHSHELFMDYVNGYPAENIENPTAWQCGTCHGDHTSLEDGIEAPLRLDGAVTSMVGGISIDLGGPSNLCVNCHQSKRGADTYTSIDTVWTEDSAGNDSIDFVVEEGYVYINSSHAGPHYGTQAQLLLGISGYGTESTMAHSDLGCVSCHMGEASDTEGGHSFHPNLANCNTSCHSSVTDITTFLSDYQTGFDARMEAIAEGLVAAGIFTEDHGIVKGIYPENVFKAFWNYRVLYSDHSHGLHNTTYVNTLLTSAETYLLGL